MTDVPLKYALPLISLAAIPLLYAIGQGFVGSTAQLVTLPKRDIDDACRSTRVMLMMMGLYPSKEDCMLVKFVDKYHGLVTVETLNDSGKIEIREYPVCRFPPKPNRENSWDVCDSKGNSWIEAIDKKYGRFF